MDATTFVGPFVPELILLGAVLLTFLLDVLEVRQNETLSTIAVAATTLALLSVLGDLGFAPLSVFATLPASHIDLAPSGAPLYAFTSLGLIFQAIFLLSALLVALASASRPSHERGAPIFYGLLLLATVGMLLVAVATDLIFLLLAIEVTSISTYLLVAYHRRESRSLEAAMKFSSSARSRPSSRSTGPPSCSGRTVRPTSWSLAERPGPSGSPSSCSSGTASSWPASRSRSRSFRSTPGRSTSTTGPPAT
jgi:hypothetical protein